MRDDRTDPSLVRGSSLPGIKRRLCFVVASEMTVRAFLTPHLRAMQSQYDVTVVVNTSDQRLLENLGVDATLVSIAIERRIAVWRDVAALWALWRLFRRRRFDAVHSLTPKAGLLAMAAAWLARTPVRIHTFTGQVWATRRGVSRAILRSCDLLVARLATTALADSPSQRDFLVAEGVRSRSAMRVLGRGSVKGVDPAVFRPNPEARQEIRERLGVAASDLLVLFVGRLTREKGVLELAEAFRILAVERSDVRLLIVGPDEEDLQPVIEAACAGHAGRVQFVEFSDRPQDFMAAADVLCLPSHREGVGTVTIEAAACGIAVVASRIYGIIDAVEDQRTGLLHPPRDVAALTDTLRRVAANPALRASLGSAGRRWAATEFHVERMTTEQLGLYAELFATVSRMPDSAHASWYRSRGKRILDVAVAAVALIALAPLVALVAVLIRATMGSPILFRQRRPGLGGVPFTLVKFRSMSDRYDERDRPDAARLTTMGRLLRASSLDELPELWNVLKGEMSLVGPRPLLMEYVPLYSAEQAKRHAVRPGITGLAQVHGRNGLAWAERFALDVEYVERHSCSIDLAILVRTVGQVLTARGIAQDGRATVDYFRGNAEVDG